MTANTTQRVDVARFDCTNGGANWCNGCYTMERHDDGDYVLHSDYAALLQQLAEQATEIERLRENADGASKTIGGLHRMVEVAERARERVESAWRFAFVSVTQSLNIKDGMKVEQARIHAEARAEEIQRAIAEDGEAVAAFLAANK